LRTDINLAQLTFPHIMLRFDDGELTICKKVDLS